MIRKLDGLCSRVVRLPGACVRCGRRSPQYQLHAHHWIKPRQFKATRWDLRNLAPLCFACHKGVHDDMEIRHDFERVMSRRRTPDEIDEIIRLANAGRKWELCELAAIADELQEALDRYEDI